VEALAERGVCCVAMSEVPRAISASPSSALWQLMVWAKSLVTSDFPLDEQEAEWQRCQGPEPPRRTGGRGIGDRGLTAASWRGTIFWCC
jgi:hypothetical protein